MKKRKNEKNRNKGIRKREFDKIKSSRVWCSGLKSKEDGQMYYKIR